MFYEEDFVEEVRQRNDVVDVISSYVNLKRTGSSYVGLRSEEHTSELQSRT